MYVYCYKLDNHAVNGRFVYQNYLSKLKLITIEVVSPRVDVGNNMQLYHHPLSLDSQKVRLALEENGIDYTSYHINPLTGKNMDASFFRMNPSGKLPVFQNGSHIIYNTIEIIQYIERIAAVSSGGDDVKLSGREVLDWMHKIQEWNPKYFTLSHVPEKHRFYVSKFIRRIVIARMAEFPDLASSYHIRLREQYDMEEKLKDPDIIRRSEEHLVRLLDDVEAQLDQTPYLVGDEFSMADVMLIPVLAREKADQPRDPC
ncbi:hypothetical protein KSS87_004585, partial [Heliosperma pusillum]